MSRFHVSAEFADSVEARSRGRSRLSPLVDGIVDGPKNVLSVEDLAELDSVLGWPQGYADALRQATSPTVSGGRAVYARAAEVKRPLAYERAGLPFRAASSVVWAAPATALIPRILSWNGTALVDVRAFAPSERWQVDKMASDWARERGARLVGRTGVPSMRTVVDAVAVDPLPGIDSLSQALRLVTMIRQAQGVFPGDSLGCALTVLAAAIDLGIDEDRNGLDLMRAGIDGGILRDLVAQSKMSTRYTVFANCEELFRGLYRARDLDVDIYVERVGGERFEVAPLPPVSAAQSLTGFLLFYDSDISPELPVVVDDALSRIGEPALVVSVKRPFEDADGCLSVSVLDSPRLADDWREGRCGYATVTDYCTRTGRAVYTEDGRARVVEIPADYVLD